MFRSRSWFGGGGLWKPKNPHSLEHLKYLYNVLSKNQVVNDHNRSLLVETLRSIAEILIWGDQNDSTVFDFFLEKNMLSFFLKIMKQKCGSYVCVQLLQTLNILFENIRNETSLYYLLSNNHVNSIIVHKFDFSDEEVMAYYISFLKTLSLKLNSHTIHFFYNEHTHDFPLYTEAIKFFNNSESMVRIAVRTLTLNVYRVRDKSMLKFIRDKTAAPYFSNLVWFIGNHVFELDNCIRENTEHESRIKLADLAAEHLDHLHYLNDILCLEINDLNQVLTEHLLYRLFIPLYVCSLDRNSAEGRTRVSSILALFLLSQVFLIMTHSPLVQLLSNILINGNENIYNFKTEVHIPRRLSLSFDTSLTQRPGSGLGSKEEGDDNSSGVMSTDVSGAGAEESQLGADDRISNLSTESQSSESSNSPQEKLNALGNLYSQSNSDVSDLNHRSILASLYESLDSSENDYAALFTLGLLHAMYDNSGINKELLDTFFHGEDEPSNPSPESDRAPFHQFNKLLTDRLISIICSAVKSEGKVRIVTLQLLTSLLLKIVMKVPTSSSLPDSDLALIEGAREENILVLQKYYSSDEMFLEVFEDEYLELRAAKPTSIEHLMMDSSLLLPPAGTPMTGICLDKRLPCGDIERSRRAMRIYFILRHLSLTLRNEPENYLPLTNTQNCVYIDDNLDLTNSDMLCCSVITRDNVKTRRYLVVDGFQLILVDPSNKKMGWGIVKFVGFLQDIEVLGDKDDSRVLHITVKTSPTNQRGSQTKTPLLSAKFMFDDHIRCMAAKQRLVKGKQIARQRKIHLIGKLLDLAGTPPLPATQSQNLRTKARRPLTRAGVFNPISKTLPGIAMPVSSVSTSSIRPSKEQQPKPSSSPRPNSNSTTQIQQQQDEEIPLGNLRSGPHQNLNPSQNLQYRNTEPLPPTPSFLAQGTHSVSSSLRLGLELPVPHQSQNSYHQTHQNSIAEESFPVPNNVEVEPITTPQSETSFMTPNSPVSNPSPVRSTANLTTTTNNNRTKKKGAIETV